MKLFVLPADGTGPEIVAATATVLAMVTGQVLTSPLTAVRKMKALVAGG